MSVAPAPIPLPAGVRVVRATPDLYHAIARRVVSQTNADVDEAASRLLHASAAHGIDFSLALASIDHAGPGGALRVRQTCLTVPGPGRTAMLFLSEPWRLGDPGGAGEAHQERVALAHAAVEFLSELRTTPTGGPLPRADVALAQSLPDPADAYALSALRDAGFQSVGTLQYLQRTPKSADRRLPDPAHPERVTWAPGFRVVCLASLDPAQHDDLLLRAMDASYEQTLDCPELCGLRTTQDILASHKATGERDPRAWWLVLQEREGSDPAPAGCALFSPCPDQQSTELVYLGLAPAARGKGLGVRLLQLGIAWSARATPSHKLTCAVDERNAPAIALYTRAGMRAFARRVALVKTVPGAK